MGSVTTRPGHLKCAYIIRASWIQSQIQFVQAGIEIEITLLILNREAALACCERQRSPFSKKKRKFLLFVRPCFVAGTGLAFHQMNCQGLSADEFTGL